MQKIKAVIFDLDGTLANTLPLCIQAFRLSIEPLIKRNISDEEIIATFGPSEEGTIMALAPDHYEKGVADYLFHYDELHGMCASAFDGIKELLQMLKNSNVRIAIVTGKGKHSTSISLKQFELTHFFEWTETGSPHGARKAAGIQAVLGELNEIQTEEVLYVGDAPSDIIASRENNIAVAAAAWAATAEPEKLIALSPDVIFYRVEDFSKWLAERI